MKTDIVLAGVGGQGILSIAAAIGLAALENSLQIKQSEVHGMSQRGGAVQSHLRISSDSIASDLIPLGSADLILSVEPMESLRYLPYLSKNGWLVTNVKPFINIPNYPGIEEILNEVEKIPNSVVIDADKIAKEAGSLRASNMAMLGASVPFLNIPYENIQNGIRQIFGRKGDKVVEINLAALEAGRKASEEKKTRNS